MLTTLISGVQSEIATGKHYEMEQKADAVMEEWAKEASVCQNGRHMSISATAVVKKETNVDPKKPADKAYYASLSVLNECGKEYGLPRLWVISVKLWFCSDGRELHTNSYMSVLPRTRGAKRSVFL